MTAVATAEASGTVPTITVNHNLAIASDLADIDITISGKDVPVQNARALVQFVETQGILVLQGDFTALRRNTGNRGSTFQAARNFLVESWSDAEKAAIADASSYQDAVKAYRKALPNGIRSDGAIKRRWLSRENKKAEQNVTPPVTPVEPIHDDPETKTPETGSQLVQQEIPAEEHFPDTKTPVSAKKSRGNNFHSGHSWVDPEEIRIVEGASSAQDAWEKHQEKYPGMRSKNAVTSRWYLARSRERVAAKEKSATDAAQVPEDTEPERGNPNKSAQQPGQVPVILIPGQQVRYNGDKSSPFYGQIGEVVKVNGTQILLDFEKGGRTWLSKEKLLTVTNAEAAAACPTS